MIIYLVTGLILGILLGVTTPVVIPQEYTKYLSVALLASLDSVFGGIRASLENKYNNHVFISGFFVNALLAAGLSLIGEILGIDLASVALIAFGLRIFQNLAIIRRDIIGK